MKTIGLAQLATVLGGEADASKSCPPPHDDASVIGVVRTYRAFQRWKHNCPTPWYQG